MDMICWKRLRINNWKDRRKASVVGCYCSLSFAAFPGKSLPVPAHCQVGGAGHFDLLVSDWGHTSCFGQWNVHKGDTQCIQVEGLESLCVSARRSSVPSTQIPTGRTHKEQSYIQPSADMECEHKGKPLLL